MRTRYRSALLAILACGVLLPAGCARFDDTAAGQTFSPAPVPSPESPPEVQGPGADSGSGPKQARPGQSAAPVPPPQGCKDFDPSVIATCLDTVAAVAGLPGDGSTPSALAGERKSGRVLLATSGKDATDFATLEVQAAGDGGLTGLALSPSYVEDQLVFAYITTATDNRVVRFAKGQSPKPVLTGIPKGASGNRGTIGTDNRGALLVATGDAGNPAAAADPNSLAGKLLRIDTSGKAAAGNPNGSLAVAAGLHAPGGVCASADGGRVWVTDRLADKDALYRIQAGQPLATPAWTWPDKPGVAGCADFVDANGSLSVGTALAGNLQNLPVSPDGAISGKPTISLDGKTGKPPLTYGRLAGMSMINPQLAVAGTVNKDGGTPVSSDDRVVLITPATSGGGNSKD
ncbi:glucose dehydrogenase [Amycolatopsis mediterranei S699]|uniref:Glucose dehydrogenase n=2 Tax=Amycolatopsis mediterranei TaxID=33910 RepID=A0A0H3D1V3_AMYMU|nr:PQQ-dependent sugar dehydrogenase [Amycolatopsis mediterranei]ADJ43491.1 glucose dehydrogenase [Amycolatopsis mediterranei U32]AEK40197.1 glucose dehydrogenase [Amycolatopsis mediterranei S699]AFO75204.1 glucose dehydrogenase [Amycolatopsis mediterranei S699]AGT82333.1 glucose dehydrogenase [Amycolatopsis mediterranei RB]KDO11603.1 glucose dehydrogenase [Amycolatopsis mediterranei]